MFGYKFYNTVIMDGTSKFANREIRGIIDMKTNRKIGRSRCRILDKSLPGMRVIKRFTNAEKYRQAKLLIEEKYPGLCSFNVRV